MKIIQVRTSRWWRGDAWRCAIWFQFVFRRCCPCQRLHRKRLAVFVARRQQAWADIGVEILQILQYGGHVLPFAPSSTRDSHHRQRSVAPISARSHMVDGTGEVNAQRAGHARISVRGGGIRLDPTLANLRAAARPCIENQVCGECGVREVRLGRKRNTTAVVGSCFCC